MTRAFYRWLSKSPGDGGQHSLSRRVLLGSAFASLLRAEKAEISSFDFSLLDDGPTPIDLFFVREHFPQPAVSSAGWKLSVTGAVAKPVEIAYDDLLAAPGKTVPVTLECAENPAAGGLVSHAEWTGVSLASILEKTGLGSDGRFIRFSGADGFSRSVPLAKAMHPDTLIAHNLNGEKLPVNHGFPLRAVIPGWYGMDSIKWLRAVEVLAGDAPAQGYMRQTRSLLAGIRPVGPVTGIHVKSTFSRPVDGAILMGRRFTVRGAAWAGESRVSEVEVSLNGGKSWSPARLASDPRPYVWVHWSYEWTIKGAGAHELSVRASDEKGRRQPAERPSDRADDYERNEYQTVHVMVI